MNHICYPELIKKTTHFFVNITLIILKRKHAHNE